MDFVAIVYGLLPLSNFLKFAIKQNKPPFSFSPITLALRESPPSFLYATVTLSEIFLMTVLGQLLHSLCEQVVRREERRKRSSHNPLSPREDSQAELLSCLFTYFARIPPLGFLTWSPFPASEVRPEAERLIQN